MSVPNSEFNLGYGYCQTRTWNKKLTCNKCHNKKTWLYQPCKWNCNESSFVCATCYPAEEIIHKPHKQLYCCQ